MKARVKIFFILALSVTMIAGCNSSKKSEAQEVAEDANEERFDDKDREKDAEFVVEAITGSFDEVKLARTAMETSEDKQVTSLAQTLETDHNAMINQLTSLAASKGISIPTEPSEKAIEKAKALQEGPAEKFKEKWLETLIERHESTINKFENAIEKASDPDIQSWAVENIAKIRMHLDALKLQKENTKGS